MRQWRLQLIQPPNDALKVSDEVFELVTLLSPLSIDNGVSLLNTGSPQA